MGRKSKTSEAASLLGRKSYKARLERLGLERLQEIARENGTKGGRPKASEAKRETTKVKTTAKKGVKK